MLNHYFKTPKKMNFLKRLFSRKDKTPPVEKNISSNPASLHDLVMNGAVERPRKYAPFTIPDDSDFSLYPFFSHRSFEGNIPNNLVGSFHRKAGEEMPEVLVNLASIQGEDLMLLNSVEMEEEEFEVLYKYAFKNLDKLEEVTFKLLEDYDNKLVLGGGSEFISETILSKKHMLKIHELLGSDDILVSVSRRNFLLACSKHESEKVQSLFVNYAVYVYKMELDTELLTTDVFFLKDGEIYASLPITQAEK